MRMLACVLRHGENMSSLPGRHEEHAGVSCFLQQKWYGLKQRQGHGKSMKLYPLVCISAHWSWETTKGFEARVKFDHKVISEFLRTERDRLEMMVSVISPVHESSL